MDISQVWDQNQLASIDNFIPVTFLLSNNLHKIACGSLDLEHERKRDQQVNPKPEDICAKQQFAYKTAIKQEDRRKINYDSTNSDKIRTSSNAPV